ncbi:hypothetical protein X777_11767 [Ooceraea biroi]|uniref:Uncharacterized protein n=1 Tax=Ooceraea biroi TaxID=2015173 RepID=A0A026W258_OOCBI|nr:hypothetical protein X777_11767 [Ooceraea biroi]
MSRAKPDEDDENTAEAMTLGAAISRWGKKVTRDEYPKNLPSVAIMKKRRRRPQKSTVEATDRLEI